MERALLHLALAFRNVIRQRRRTAIAVSAVCFGIAALLVAGGFVEWMLLAFREDTIRSQLGHLQIVRPHFHSAGKADPYKFLLPEAPPDLEEGTDQKQKQVKIVAPRLSFSGLVSRGDATVAFIGEGVDPEKEAFFGDALQISSGEHLNAKQPRTVIMGEGLARNLGVKIGDQVILVANTASGGTNAVEVSIRGTFASVSKAYDDAALRIPIATARELLRTKGSHVWVVLLNNTSDTDTVLGKIRKGLPEKEFEVVPWYDLADIYNKTARLFLRQMDGVRWIIALIILLSISNTIMTSVMERTAEIGTSMALGVKRAGILRLFLTEGVLIGLLGGILGVLIGWIAAEIISMSRLPMAPPPGVAHSYTIQVLVTHSMVLNALVLAALTTLLASAYPAWTASRKQIVDALRHSR